MSRLNGSSNDFLKCCRVHFGSGGNSLNITTVPELVSLLDFTTQSGNSAACFGCATIKGPVYVFIAEIEFTFWFEVDKVRCHFLHQTGIPCRLEKVPHWHPSQNDPSQRDFLTLWNLYRPQWKYSLHTMPIVDMAIDEKLPVCFSSSKKFRFFGTRLDGVIHDISNSLLSAFTNILRLITCSSETALRPNQILFGRNVSLEVSAALFLNIKHFFSFRCGNSVVTRV